MEIYDKRKDKSVFFNTLKVGDTFYDENDEFHAMRIADCEDSEGCVNAVSLASGSLYLYSDHDIVVPTKVRVEVYA